MPADPAPERRSCEGCRWFSRKTADLAKPTKPVCLKQGIPFATSAIWRALPRERDAGGCWTAPEKTP